MDSRSGEQCEGGSKKAMANFRAVVLNDQASVQNREETEEIQRCQVKTNFAFANFMNHVYEKQKK